MTSGRKAKRRPTLTDEITAAIGERILNGDLQPGDRIAELHIAEEFGTSQAPVREAFATLRSEGLIVSLPHRGSFVSEVSQEEAEIAYELRALIEPYVIERAIRALTDADVRELRDFAAAMADAASTEDHPSFAEADMRLHGHLYSRTGSALISKTWDYMSTTIRKFIVATSRETFPGELVDVAAMHLRLVERLVERDVDGAVAEWEAHHRLLGSRIHGTGEDADDS